MCNGGRASGFDWGAEVVEKRKEEKVGGGVTEQNGDSDERDEKDKKDGGG